MPLEKGALEAMGISSEERERVFDAFRRWGYLQADLDPLGYLKPQPHPDLEVVGSAADLARRYYCGTIGVEFAHIPEPDRRRWIQERIETEPPRSNTSFILERLIRATVFEQVLQSRYPGTRRFSLEGVVALVPLLDEVLHCAAEHGTEHAVVALSHRGRLSVIVHIAGRPAAEVFGRFEDVDSRSFLGGGDVKYHLGAAGYYVTTRGHKIDVHLVSNPSHLEAVDPVAMGRARAKQIRLGQQGNTLVLPVLLHGDAAFAGQGIAAETLNLSNLEGFSVGGSIHVIVNNLIGFTTKAVEAYSSRFSSDVAKRLPIPIFHVNAEDPDAVVRVARLAAEYRFAFNSSVMVDLIGYRRHGHSEIEDPTTTNPVRYRKIKELPPLWQSYARKIQVDPTSTAAAIHAEYDVDLRKARGLKANPRLYELPDYWAPYKGGRYRASLEVNTGLTAQDLRAISEAITRYPRGFAIHPKVKRLLDQRAQMGRGEHDVDFGMAEALAFGSLLKQGIPVRLSGQDSRRGTFNQRHAALVDTETEEEYVPLSHVHPTQARFEIYNSVLSEAAVLGFEYGFSRDYPEALVMWEAQFGDFSNGAQVIIDQFIVAGEDKWNLLSGLVLLLPHGYDGQGPEHSSARVERFIQLAARDNIQICQPSTAAQYFHLLRRQALRVWRKPLVVLTPKSLLRNPAAASRLEAFSAPCFSLLLPDGEIAGAERILIASGKIVHELRAERQKRNDSRTAIVALEQFYPFPEKEIAGELARHATAHEIVWVQEEPANMGALFFIMPYLRRLARGRSLRSVRRSPSPSPATGSAKAHEIEQKALLALAFGPATT